MGERGEEEGREGGIRVGWSGSEETERVFLPLPSQ